MQKRQLLLLFQLTASYSKINFGQGKCLVSHRDVNKVRFGYSSNFFNFVVLLTCLKFFVMSKKEYIWPEGEELVFVRPPKEEYNGKLDCFYSPDLFPELSPLKENWKAIREEILAFEKSRGVLAGMSPFTVPDTAGGQWTVTYLMSFLMQYHKNRKDFPFISSVIDKIPDCVFASISILPPNTEIKPHFGDTNGIVRSHLALIVPEEYPTIGIRVGNEERGWKEGELLCFINVQRHSVWNRSSSRRYVLMVDFVPKNLANRKMEICSKGLGSQSFIILYNRIPIIKYMPQFVHNFMCWIATIFWRIALPIQRRFEFLDVTRSGAG